MNRNISQKGYQTNQTPRNQMGRTPNPQLNQPNQLQQQPGQSQSYYGNQQQSQQQQPGQNQQLNRGPNAPNATGQANRMGVGGAGGMQNNTNRLGQQTQSQQQMSGQQQQQQQKKPKYYLAMFDYDPTTMSPNPDGCEEELPFQEGDTIKVSVPCRGPVTICPQRSQP